MKAIKNTWEFIGWGLSIYTIFKQLQTLREAKNDLYDQLTPELQAEWRRVFGNPAVQAPINPLPPAPAAQVHVVIPNDLQQIKAGT